VTPFCGCRPYHHPGFCPDPGVDDVLALATNGDLVLAGAPVETVTASLSERTIEGLIVPFGKVGVTSRGPLTFSAGSITWSDPKRVKLLVEHDQRESVGHALELRQSAEGIWGKYHVPEGADGDKALQDAAHGKRDAFSVGVQLDAATERAIRRAMASGGVVAGAGQLRETSLVSVPAFDDARVSGVAANGTTYLAVTGWTDPAGTTHASEDPAVTYEQMLALARAGQLTGDLLIAHAAGLSAEQMNTLATAGQPPAPAEPPAAPLTAPAPVTSPPAPVATASAGVAAPAGATPGPVPMVAAAGAAYVTAEASVYAFDGGPTSLVRDAWNSRENDDRDARDRLSRFNAQLAGGNAPSVMALAAVETTDTMPNIVPQEVHRPDLFRRIIDRGRPIISRLQVVPLTDATPYGIPIEGEFEGVEDHTQGDANQAADGEFDIDGALVQPKPKSGKYPISRELVDASNPALDSIAINAMLRNYRRGTEKGVVAALRAAGLAAVTAADLAAYRQAQLNFDAGDDIPPDFAAMGRPMFNAYASEMDGDGNPKLRTTPYNPIFGTMRAGYTGADVDGVELVRASAITDDDGWMIRGDSVHVAESRTQTFRFEEVEGPGKIVLALWGYFAAKVHFPAGIDHVSLTA
jgi:HK97 family phage prohead protease